MTFAAAVTAEIDVAAYVAAAAATVVKIEISHFDRYRYFPSESIDCCLEHTAHVAVVTGVVPLADAVEWS